jgi:hypothetical protein
MVTISEHKPINDIVNITHHTRVRWPVDYEWPSASEFKQLEIAHDFFDRHSLVARTNPDALLASAIVHGIPWSGPQYGKIGITLGESSEPLPSAWRKVLESGQLPDPVRAVPLDRSIGMSRR